MRALKIAGAAVAAVIVVIALLLVVGIPSGFLTSTIEDRVERETGYRLTIAGTTKISLWPTLNVTLERPHAAGSEGPRRHQPRDHRQRAGRHDAVERLVGPVRTISELVDHAARCCTVPLLRERIASRRRRAEAGAATG